MKGKKKYIVPLLLAGVTAMTGAPAVVSHQQQTVAHAETAQTGVTNIASAELKIKKGFEDIYMLGTEEAKNIPMPEVVGADASKVTYTITRGTSKNPVAVIKGDATDKTFSPKYTGAYNVSIKLEEDGALVSELTGLTIMVEKAEAAIKLPTNSKYVVPAQLPTSNEKGLKVPAPSVVLTDEYGKETTKTAAEAGLDVSLIAPNSETAVPLVLSSDGTYYDIGKSQLSVPGTYQIRYEYKSGDAILSKLETNFQVVDDLKAPEKLYLKLQGSVPSTGNVGTNISVPRVTVLDSAGATDGINAHVSVVVSKINSKGESIKDFEIDYDTYTFNTSEVEGLTEQEGNYIVTYKADLNELYTNCQSVPYSPATIIKVSDNKEPSVMATYPYKISNGEVVAVDENYDYTVTYDEGNPVYKTYNYRDFESDEKVEDVLVNRKVEVPSVAVQGEPFRLPAIFGIDNKDGVSDLEFTREVVGNNIAKYTVQAKANEVSENIKLSNTGNYEIRYIAKDKAGKTIRATYSLVVKAKEDLAEGKTTVNLNVGTSAVSYKDTITFSKPTAKDTFDAELDVVTGYRIYEGTTLKNTVYLNKTNSNGKYSISVKDDILANTANADKIEVFAVATADRTLMGTRGDEVFVTDTKTEVVRSIEILPSNDSTAPTFMMGTNENVDASVWNSALLTRNTDNLYRQEVAEILSDGYAGAGAGTLDKNNHFSTTDGKEYYAPFDQGKKELKLPAVTFADADSNLKVRLTIKDRFGNTVTKATTETVAKSKEDGETEWKYTIDGASFKLSASGLYTVTYRAEDTMGNTTVRSFGIRVNDKTAPTIVVEDEDRFGVDIEVGEFFEVPAGNLIKDGVDLGKPVTWTVTTSDGAEYDLQPTGFTPLTAGTFYVKYEGSDSFGIDQVLQDNSIFYVNAKDTTAPVFNDDSSYILNPTKQWNPVNDEMKIDIPVVYATDPIKNEAVEVVYTVTSPDGSKITVKDYTDEEKVEKGDDVRYFVAKKQGKYTIKYEATDAANNTVSMTKELALGDCDAPTITWADEETNIKASVKLGETFSLSFADDIFTIKDNVTTDRDTLIEKMTIKMMKPDGTTATEKEAGRYNWVMSETGAYTLNITVKDEAGMSRTYKYTINVTEEEVKDNVVDSVVGTILIVSAVVIFAGVVVYFIVSSRKKSKPNTRKAKKND